MNTLGPPRQLPGAKFEYFSGNPHKLRGHDSQKREGCGTNRFRSLSTLTIVIVLSYIHIGIVLRFQGAPEEHIFQKSRGGADQITRRVKQTGEI